MQMRLPLYCQSLLAAAFLLPASLHAAGTYARLHVGDDQTRPILETADALADPDVNMTSVQVTSLDETEPVLQAAGDQSFDQIALQLFGHRRGFSAEEEAAQAGGLLEKLLAHSPDAKILLLQTWTEGSGHYDEITGSWDAYAWADKTLKALEQQQKTAELLEKQFGEDRVVLVPLGKAIFSVHGKLAQLGSDSPFYEMSEFIAEFGMSPNLTRPGIYLGALTFNHVLDRKTPEDLPADFMISADYLDPAQGPLSYGPDAVEILRDLARKAAG